MEAVQETAWRGDDRQASGDTRTFYRTPGQLKRHLETDLDQKPRGREDGGGAIDAPEVRRPNSCLQHHHLGLGDLTPWP